jgi:hypothetical protein
MNFEFHEDDGKTFIGWYLIVIAVKHVAQRGWELWKNLKEKRK